MPRLCYALDLHDDPALIAEYERWHRPDTIWPEVVDSIRAAGIRELEIHRCGDRLVLIMDVDDDYDPAAKAQADRENPRVQAWEELMWRFQKPLAGTPAGEKWRAMQRIFALSQAPGAHGSALESSASA